ncbi:MAG: TldD/PmbA family protein [Methanobrevibacter sp.]|jgi:TldD protein|nr:TldD/PmbA family protein [Candidatus Methanovirga basalitermitum]
MDEYIDKFKNLLDRISSDVDYSDIRAIKSNSTNLIMKDSKIQEINSGLNIGARIRVLKNGAWGFAYTNDLNKLEEISKTSIKLANSLSGDVELSDEMVVEDKVKINTKIPVSDVSIEDKKELISEADKSAKVKHVVSTTVSYSDVESEKLFLSSEGSKISINETIIAMFLNSTASSGDVIQFGHGSIGGVTGFEVLKNADIEKFGRKIGENASRLLKAKSSPSGNFTVVADNELTGVLIHEALGHGVEGDLILQNDSILKGCLGNDIGSDLVNIFDDASRVDGFGYYPYDDEGIKTKINQLVKNGKLISILNSRETGFKLDMKSSGNARSTLNEQTIVRMSNTYLEPGDMNFDELIEDVKEGIYIKGSRGGQVDTGKGIFQFSGVESFKIENGEVKDSLRDASLSGDILNTLKEIDAVGSDFKLSVGFCGKGGQTVPVGDGGPHIRIKNAIVGGSN